MIYSHFTVCERWKSKKLIHHRVDNNIDDWFSPHFRLSHLHIIYYVKCNRAYSDSLVDSTEISISNLWKFVCYLQISTLVQHRSERPHITSATSERTLRAIGRVGQAVNLAVERFVTVGEAIADDNHDIKQDMYDACKEARAAGELLIAFISSLTDAYSKWVCMWLLFFGCCLLFTRHF